MTRMVCFIGTLLAISHGFVGDAQTSLLGAQENSAKSKDNTIRTPPSRSTPRTRSAQVVPLAKSARTLLKLAQIDESMLNFLVDGEEITQADEDTIVRILHRTPQFSHGAIRRWIQEPIPWEKFAEDPNKYRADYYHLRGRATRLEVVPLQEEVAELLEYDEYYRLEVKTDDDRTVLLCARFVPQQWLDDAERNYRVEFDAMFLKVGPSINEQPAMVFATNRVGWYPTKSRAGVPDDWVRLANHGVDIGLFDNIKKTQGIGFSGEDRESFYQMLIASKQADVAVKGAKEMKLSEVLTKPENWIGRQMKIQGDLRRLTVVHLDDLDARQRFGIESYYQLDVFVPIPKQRIRLGDKSTKNAPVFRNHFPVTVCTTKLPKELQSIVNRRAQGKADEDRIRIPITMNAAFFKIWSYRTKFVSQQNDKLKQVGPLVIATQVGVVKKPKATAPSGLGIGIAFVVVLGVLWFLLMRTEKRDKAYVRAKLRNSLE